MWVIVYTILSSWLCLNLANFFQIISIKIMSGVDEMYMENLDEWIFEENKVQYMSFVGYC
jgi:hypothetical protein